MGMVSAPDSLPKLTRPRLRDTLRRPRLFRQLDTARQSAITWVVGPPGAGKTTLAASYLDYSGLSSVWYQVDEGDAHVASFFYYLGLAGKAHAAGEQGLPLFTPEYALGLPVFTRRFFEQLSYRLSSPFILALDNYQLVPDESPLHDVIATAAETIAGPGHILVVSRAPPPTAFARLQANRQLEIIDWESLKLRDDEIEGLYHLLGEDQVCSRELLQGLRAQSGGWAAGLILLLRGLNSKANGEITLSPEGEPPQVLFDYFANETFRQQDAAIQDFLLRTAILPRVTPETAQQLSGNPDADQILSHLNKNHYFTERHSEVELFYQYHPLFREFLLATARQHFSVEDYRELECRGANLLEQTGHVEAASDLYLSAQDWMQFTRLLYEHAQPLIMQGRGGAVLQWIDRVPESVMSDSAWLKFWSGMACMGTAPLEARESLVRAYEQFKSTADMPGTCLALTGIIDTFGFGWNDFHPLDAWIDELEKLLAEHPALPSPELHARVVVAMFTALMHRRPQDPGLKLWAQRAHEVARNSPSPDYRLIVGLHLGTYYVWWGLHREMALLLDELRPLVEGTAISPISYIMFRIIQSMYYTRSLEGEGVRSAREALAQAEQSGVYMLNSLALGFAALSSIHDDNLDDCAGFLSRFAAILHPARPLDQGFYHWLHGHLAYLQGDTRSACDHARQCVEIAQQSGSVFHQHMTPISLARILIEDGQCREASEIIDGILPGIRNMKNESLEYECLLVEAQRAFAENDQPGAFESLRAGLTLMRQIDSVTVIWWKPEWLTPLLTRALEAGIEVEHVQSVIHRNGLTPNGRSAVLENWPWRIRVRALGGFTLERDGEPLEFKGKAQKKPLELLKALLAFGGRGVSSTKLADTLWPDAEADAAQQSLKMALHRLRKLLNCDAAIEVHQGNVSLSPLHCWIDVWAFENLLQNRTGSTGSVPANREKANALYRGHFLGDDDDAVWALSCRERLHNRFVRNTLELGAPLEDKGHWGEALEVYERGLQIDDLVESFYQGVMRCHEALGMHADALATFERCRGTIEARFGVPLSKATTQIAQRLQTFH